MGAGNNWTETEKITEFTSLLIVSGHTAFISQVDFECLFLDTYEQHFCTTQFELTQLGPDTGSWRSC